MQPNGCFLVKLEIDGPMAEISCSEMLNMSTSMLLDNYHDILQETVVQLLEDTTWVNDTTMSTLLNAGFGMYHVREHDVIISLRKSALQRLISQSMTNSDDSEALDLAVRNLTAEWRNEFRRLVERDKRSGPAGTLPFKLALPH